ncbi:MAG: PKD domain-containing protein, partial [Thermoplasmata archaeon]|nr:PKD domain-containing protein [Thermoplasmata archaeon]
MKGKEWFERAGDYLGVVKQGKITSAFVVPTSVVLVILLVLPGILNVTSDTMVIYMDKDDISVTQGWNETRMVSVHFLHVEKTRWVVVGFTGVVPSSTNLFGSVMGFSWPLDRESCVFVFPVSSNITVTFATNPGMVMTLSELPPDRIINVTGNTTVRGIFYKIKYGTVFGDITGVVLNLTDTGWHYVEFSADNATSFLGMTRDGTIVRYNSSSEGVELFPPQASRIFFRNEKPTSVESYSVYISRMDMSQPVRMTYPIAIARAGDPVYAGETMSFSSLSLGENLTEEWDFGDGTNETGHTVSHVYENDGIYNVTLRVTDKNGNVSVDSIPVKVLNIPPVARIIAPGAVVEDEEFTLTAEVNDTPADVRSMSYQWFLPGGTVRYGKNISCSLNRNASSQILLVVRDDNGAIATDTKIINVVNLAPQILSIPGSVTEIINVTQCVPENGTASGGSGGDSNETGGHANGATGNVTGNGTQNGCIFENTTEEISIITVNRTEEYAVVHLVIDADDTPSDKKNLRYIWRHNNTEWGRGDIFCSFNSSGVYNWTAVVVDDNNASCSMPVQVVVENTPPIAKFTYAPRDPYQFENVSFDASLSTDPDGDPLRYVWDFGDGAGGKGMLINHTYRDDGVYNVFLYVVDPSGAVGVHEEKIKVLNHPPTAVFSTYQNACFTLRVAGKKWNSVNLTVYESDGGGNERKLGNVAIVREPGDPDKQSKTINTTLDIQKNNYFVIEYNANALGDNPVWVNVSLGGGEWYEFFVNFNVATLDENQYRYRDINSVLGMGDITFDATKSYDLDPDPGTTAPLGYFWDFGDGTTSTGSVVTHGFDTDGTYNVTLTVVDDDGASDTLSMPIEITAHKPFSVPMLKSSTSQVYQIDVFDYSVQPNKKVMFDGSEAYDMNAGETGGTLTYTWDFGDGATAAGMMCKHTYSSPGIYPVSLTVRDSEGFTDTGYIFLHVESTGGPVADAGPDRVLYKNLPATFDGSGSYDTGGQIISYIWDFGDGTTATGRVVTHTYSDTGLYAATLTVVDDQGREAYDTAMVEVINQLPIADAGEDMSVKEDEIVYLDATGSYDPDGGALTYLWDFDLTDGIQVDATGPQVSCVYREAGVYTVSLTVIDDEGGKSVDTLNVTVSNVPPSAEAEAWSSDGEFNTTPGMAVPHLIVKEDEDVFFTGTGHDTPSDLPNLTYRWVLSDGTIIDGREFFHSFTFPGIYTAVLYVKDDDFAVGKDTVVVEVKNTLPLPVMEIKTGDGESPQTIFDLRTFFEDERIVFDAGKTVDTQGDIPWLVYRWDMGDGTVLFGKTVDYSYPVSGNYTVSLTVIDDNMAASTTTRVLSILNQKPSVSLSEEKISFPNYQLTATVSDTPTDLQNLTYHWEFGDGTTSNDPYPVHTFPFSGKYNVKVTIHDGDENATAYALYNVSLDSDGDLLPDIWETTMNLDPNGSTGENGTFGDPDQDLFFNILEYKFGTDPMDNDTDDDWLTDYEEWFTYLTEPLIKDTDNDSLFDGQEVYSFFYYRNVTLDRSLYAEYHGTAVEPLVVEKTLAFHPGDYRVTIKGRVEKSETAPTLSFSVDGSPVNYTYETTACGENGEEEGGEEITYNLSFKVGYGEHTISLSSNTTTDAVYLEYMVFYRQNTNPIRPDTDLDLLKDGTEVKN